MCYQLTAKYRKIIHFILLLFIRNILTYSENNASIQKLCLDQEMCHECLQADPLCNWCYDEKYIGRRCKISFSSSCDETKIEKNSQVDVSVKMNEEFSYISDNVAMEKVIQIKPQHIHVKLRKGIPVTFNFTYKPAANYPLDLYYLADLSASMESSLEILKTLGQNLSLSLNNLTNNYRLAYGSFVDKTDMPFYFTDPESVKNPCYSLLKTCEPAYLFKHRLNFTADTQKFSEKVNSSRITANVDDLDGALDAILQILVCGEKVGWSQFSRKIILLPTDSLLHMAGDGLLVGAVLKPTETCMLDETGKHSEPLKHDYPTMEQIKMILGQKKVNIIFAVNTKEKLDYYMSLSRSLLKEHALVSKLEKNSENILEVIKEGYYNFAGQVNFYINTSYHENIDVKFFADCENKNKFNETSSCYGLTDKPVNFKVELTLKDNPRGAPKEDLIFVEEKDINEKLMVSVSYLGQCECPNIKDNVLECKNNGTLSCGVCSCTEDWTGEDCSESCSLSNLQSCWKNDENVFESRACSGNGICDCGKCHCNNLYQGKVCQFKCPVNNKNQICSGPAQGKCIEGQCICESGFEGETCSCSLSTDDCTFGGITCSGNGFCKCNHCNCREGFYGKYCEYNKDNNNTICENYDSAVETWCTNKSAVNSPNPSINYPIEIFAVTESETSDWGDTCETQTYEGNSICAVSYSYYEANKSVQIPVMKKCLMSAGLKSTVGGALIIFFTILVGIIILAIIKYKRYREDRMEYEKFKNAQSNFNMMNPVYRSPVVHYKNPMRNGRDENSRTT